MVLEIYDFPVSSQVRSIFFESTKLASSPYLGAFVVAHDTKLQHSVLQALNRGGIKSELSADSRLPTEKSTVPGIKTYKFANDLGEFSLFKQKILDILKESQLISGEAKIERVDLIELANKQIIKLRRELGIADRVMDAGSIATSGGFSIGNIFKFLGRGASSKTYYLQELEKYVRGEIDHFPNLPRGQTPGDFGR